jgi:hypothetical protein
MLSDRCVPTFAGCDREVKLDRLGERDAAVDAVDHREQGFKPSTLRGKGDDKNR